MRVATERALEAEGTAGGSGEGFELGFQIGARRDVEQVQPAVQERARDSAQYLAETEIDDRESAEELASGPVENLPPDVKPPAVVRRPNFRPPRRRRPAV